MLFFSYFNFLFRVKIKTSVLGYWDSDYMVLITNTDLEEGVEVTALDRHEKASLLLGIGKNICLRMRALLHSRRVP